MVGWADKVNFNMMYQYTKQGLFLGVISTSFGLERAQLSVDVEDGVQTRVSSLLVSIRV